jgi:hypothetical protein
MKVTKMLAFEGGRATALSTNLDLDYIQQHDKWVQDASEPNANDKKLYQASMAQLPEGGQRQKGTVVLVLYQREEIKLDDGTSMFFSAAVLPHPNMVPVELKRKYRYTQQDQGVYVFRNGRLVVGGQTLGLFGNDFHLNAFRADLEYTSAADEHVLVDVAKSNVAITPEVLSRLQELVKVCTRTASTLWREKDVLTDEDIKGLFDKSNRPYRVTTEADRRSC